MKINFSDEGMDKLMSLSRYLKTPPHIVVDKLLRNIEFEEALSYYEEENKKPSKKE